MECSGGWPTAVRGKFLAYTDPIFFSPYYIYIRADETRFKTLSDFNHAALTTAVIIGENSALIRDEIFANTKAYELAGTSQGGDLLQAVIARKADFTILDSPSMAIFMSHNPDKLKVFSPDKPLRLVAINASMALDEIKLKAVMDTATRDLVYSGTIDKILDHYDPHHTIYIRADKPFVKSGE